MDRQTDRRTESQTERSEGRKDTIKERKNGKRKEEMEIERNIRTVENKKHKKRGR